MATNQPDFVNVQLSAAGVLAAGTSGTITITTPHFNYAFTASDSTRVLTSEWSKLLSKETIEGQIVLQLVPQVLVTVAQGASAADEIAALKAEEEALEEQTETETGN